MNNLVLCVTLNILFFINNVYSAVRVTPLEKSVNFTPKQSFKLKCNVTYDGSDVPEIKWERESKKVDIDNGRNKATWDEKSRISTLSVEKAADSDSGNYSCIAYINNVVQDRAEITATREIAVKVPSNVNVVEEEKLRIECKVVGNAKLYWVFKNVTYPSSSIPDERVKIENYIDDGKTIENGVFIIEGVTKDDRGNVTCIGEDIYINQTAEDTCMIRIKDKYAALWPFLGICAEVIILCAIIVIYEKKRNKTELEESDTDQSPDQKNTPDNGKEANLRHRQ